MTAEPPSEPDSDDFPSLDLAYGRAITSYGEMAGHRYDEANRRIDGLLTLTSTVTLAAPADRRRDGRW